jgi:hypothetical protein
MEAIRSSETSVLIRATWRHLPDDDNHQMCTSLPTGPCGGISIMLTVP